VISIIEIEYIDKEAPMEDKYKVNISSIKYKDDEQAKKDFANLIISYILNQNLIPKGDK